MKDVKSIEVRSERPKGYHFPPQDFRITVHGIIGTETAIVQAWEASPSWGEHSTRQRMKDGRYLGKIATRKIESDDADHVARTRHDLTDFAFDTILKNGQRVVDALKEQGFEVLDSQRDGGDLQLTLTHLVR